MTLADPKSGGWSLGELLTHTQQNAIRTELLKAVDGVNGGTYALAAPLIFTTDDVRLDSDDIDIVSGGELSVQDGGQIAVELNGALNWESGSDALLGAGATLTVEDISDLVVDDDTIQPRVSLQPLFAVTGEWEFFATLGWIQTGVGSSFEIYFPLIVEPGDDINFIRVNLEGDAGGTGPHSGFVGAGNLPDISLIEGAISGPSSVLATEVDTSATDGSYDAQHNVELNNTTSGGVLPYTTLLVPYYLRVRGESGTNSIAAALAINSIIVEVVRRKVTPELIM